MRHRHTTSRAVAAMLLMAAGSSLALLTSCGPSPSPAAPSTPSARGGTSASDPADSIYYGQRDVPARRPGAVRIATYNLLNLFDDIDDPAYSGAEEDIDDAKPPSERQAVADVIRRIDADVLALQEIESESALREFRDQYLAGLGYDHLVSIDTGDPRGIECAILSRFPVSNIQTWAGLELGGTHPAMWGNQPNAFAGQSVAFKRSPLRVDVTIPAPVSESQTAPGLAPPYVLTLFVLHNKSGGPGGYWREAESRMIVRLVADVRDANPDANIILLGDLNARNDDPSVRILLDAGLNQVYPYDPANHNATISHESGRRIDHILITPAVLPELIEGSAFILGTPGRPPGSDWRTTPAPAGLASDHYPLAVEFWIGDR